MAYTVKPEKKADWKKKAMESANKARELIMSIGRNYVRNPDSIAEVLAFASNFYHYSINNTELIYAQNPRASFVQSYEGWKKMDAQVIRGETGIKIWVPVKATFLMLDENNYVPLSEATAEQKESFRNGYIEGKTRTTYKVGYVFDIGQTNFPKEKYPELYSMGYSSDQHATIVRGLINFCKEQGCIVETKSLSSIATRGYYNGSTYEIALNEKLEDTQRLSTLSHEIGHLLQNHGSRECSASQKEFEADCLSVLIQCHFGIELNDSRKSHLSDHFKLFEAEQRKQNPDMAEDEVIKQIENVLDVSMKVFRQFIEPMEKYVKIEIENHPIAVSLDNKPLLTFYYEVNECQEFPSMGKTYSPIQSAVEALSIFNDIPENRKSLIGGINIIGIDTSGNILEVIPVSFGQTIDLSLFEYYPVAKENMEEKKMIKEIVDLSKKEGFQTYGSYDFGVNNKMEQHNRRNR